MPVKVKRGLGLLVVAVIGYFVVSAAQESAGSTAATIAEAFGWALVAVGMIGGLLLLAWGLLRD